MTTTTTTTRAVDLVPRELAVLRLVAAGRSNPEIAKDLYLSMETVKAACRTLYGALGARSRAHAVDLAWRAGILGTDR